MSTDVKTNGTVKVIGILEAVYASSREGREVVPTV